MADHSGQRTPSMQVEEEAEEEHEGDIQEVAEEENEVEFRAKRDGRRMGSEEWKVLFENFGMKLTFNVCILFTRCFSIQLVITDGQSWSKAC